MKVKFLFFIICFVSLNGKTQNKFDLSTPLKIWDNANHNAFTTLVTFDGYLYCAFREGNSHRSFDGKIRIIRSKDLKNWKSVGLISSKNEDLRDPKMVILDNQIILLFVSRTQDKHYSYTYSSSDGLKWKYLDKTNDTWRWNATIYDNTIYSVGYSGIDKEGQIYKTTNGVNWYSVKKPFFKNKYSQTSETKLFFTSKGKMFAIARNEKGNQHATLGTSNFPYSNWSWQDLGIRLGSPAGIMLNDSTILAVARTYNPMRTSMLKIDVNDASYKLLSHLPSSGDCGYADISIFNNEYYISYYTMDKKSKKMSIYLIKVDI